MRVAGALIPELLHVVYEPKGSLDTWMRSVTAAFSRAVGVADSAFGLTGYEDGAAGLFHQRTEFAGSRVQQYTEKFYAQMGAQDGRAFALPRGAFLRYYFPHALAVTHSEVEKGSPENDISRMRVALGAKDMLGLVLHPVPGLAATLSCMLDEELTPSRPLRGTLTRLGLHIENALRLRLKPEAVSMVLSPDGRVLDSTVGKREVRPLRFVEKHRGDGQARLMAWTALVDGSHSLVEREDSDGKCYYLLLENAPRGRKRRGLSPVEATIVRHTARGLLHKHIAYSLGLSPASISAALSQAGAKLGFATTARLARAVRLLIGEAATLDRSALTAAERDVLALLVEGRSNKDIGIFRGTSERTIANQVASILRKTSAPSRRALQLAR